jgi:hypothetical protein
VRIRLLRAQILPRLLDFRQHQSVATAGYLGNVSEKNRVDTLNYHELNATTLLHGSPETVVRKA